MNDELDLNTKEGLESAIIWQTNFCNLLSEGGKWGVPRSFATYTIYKSKKIAVRTKSDLDVDLVFKAMGWELKEKP